MSFSVNRDATTDICHHLLDALGDTSSDYYYLFDFKTHRIYFSSNIRDTYDVMRGDAEYCTPEEWSRVVYPWDLSAISELYQSILNGTEPSHHVEYRTMDRAGNIIWLSSRGKLQKDEEGRPVCIIGRLSESGSADKADRFTGTFTMDYLKVEVAKLLEEEVDGFLLLMGVDDLKSINLKMGREFGDAILTHVVQALESVTRGGRKIYRVNGDCFAVNLPGMDREKAAAVIEQTQQQLAGQCTLSGGCVPFREYRVPDADTLYQYAENTLDRAKEQGKNRLLFFSADDYEKGLAALELTEDLQKSVQNGVQGFSLLYQPQVHSDSYRLYGAEALLRYSSPRRGPLSPLEFVPVLERTELICPVGIWVLDTALAQCREWRTHTPDFHISVNVSYTQLCQEGIVEDVLQALERSGLPGSALTLEITESMQLLDYPHINEIFRKWTQRGIEISVDDFGTGYSSLGRLKELEIDEIKIDRCFVNNIQHSLYNYRLLSNMLELADSCQIRVCCEGVETKEELTVLEELHPSLLQGFLFSKPCTPADLEALYLDPAAKPFQERLLREAAYRKKICAPEVSSASEWKETELARAILDAENDIFYISDPDTYELYYLNPAGQRLMGLRDYRGRKCYSVLQGREEPCAFCTNSILKKDHFYIWDQHNEHCGRHFLLKDKLITYQGHPLRLEVALDITKHEIVSQSTQERLQFAQKIAGYTRTLSHYADYGEAVRQVLASVGEFYQSDRAYLFEPSADQDGCWSNTFEWCADNVQAQRGNLQDVTPDLLHRWMELFAQDKSILIYNLDSLRRENPGEWKVLHDQGINRLIAVPIRDGDKTIGFIGVDNPRYSIHDDSQIRVLSSFLLNRIRQDRNENRYRALLQANHHDIFDTLSVGLWIIRMDKDRKHCEMLADDTMHRVLGISGVPSAEECYQFWYSRINDGYHHYVNQSVESMIQTYRPVQLEYTWKHPQRGEVLVRCTGIRAQDEDGLICLKGYHRIINDLERPHFVPDMCARDIFEFHENTQTIFFHTDRTLLFGDDVRASHFPQCWIDDETVHPHFVAEFRSIFTQLQSRTAPAQQELLLKSKSGTYEWFKLTLQHLSKEPQDQDSAIVVLEPIGSERVMELEYMRMRKFYQALLSEAIAYAEVDLESGQLKSVGGLWEIYKPDYRRSSPHFIEVMVQQLSSILPEKDLKVLRGYRNPEVWREKLRRGETSSRFCYRRPVGETLHWVELTMYLFEEDVTKNAYALVYLKDIQAEKERELAQADAANRDPLTHIYNRSAFEREVTRHVLESAQDPCGTLLMMDIDDFKQINDQYGHLEGDKALQKVSHILSSTFRQDDIIGRLGGDEFLVYVRGAVRREALEERLERLLSQLRSGSQSLTGSIGLTVVTHSGFQYRQVLQQADRALYESKRRGKNCFCFYEEDV